MSLRIAAVRYYAPKPPFESQSSFTTILPPCRLGERRIKYGEKDKDNTRVLERAERVATPCSLNPFIPAIAERDSPPFVNSGACLACVLFAMRSIPFVIDFYGDTKAAGPLLLGIVALLTTNIQVSGMQVSAAFASLVTQVSTMMILPFVMKPLRSNAMPMPDAIFLRGVLPGRRG